MGLHFLKSISFIHIAGNHAKKFFEHHQEIPALVLANQAQEDIEAYQTLMKKLFYILRVNTQFRTDKS